MRELSAVLRDSLGAPREREVRLRTVQVCVFVSLCVCKCVCAKINMTHGLYSGFKLPLH